MKALTGQHQQVVRGVVAAIPITVVNDLSRQEGAAQSLSGELTVQRHLLSELAVPDPRVPLTLLPSSAAFVSLNRWLLAPQIKASEQRRMGTFLFNLAAVLGSLVTTAIIVMLLWDKEGPHLRKRLREQWHKQASLFALLVITLPT